MYANNIRDLDLEHVGEFGILFGSVLVQTEPLTLADVFLVSYYGTRVPISAGVILTKTILNPSPFKFYCQ